MRLNTPAKHALSLMVVLAGSAAVMAQTAPVGRVVRPNAVIHSVADLNRSVAFYRDQVGLELDTDAALPSMSGRELGALVNAVGASVKTATFKVPGTESRLLLAEFSGVSAPAIHPRLQDPGQMKTVLRVRDIDAEFARVQKGLTGVHSTGGAPVRPEGPNGTNRAVITKDPDGSPLEFVFQNVPPIPDTIPATTNIVGGWASFVVQDLPTTIDFYKTHFGFDIRNPGRQASAPLLALQGLPDATTTMSTGSRPPGAAYTWFMYAYGGVDKKAIEGHLASPGATGVSLIVENLPAMLTSLKAAGVRVETDGGQPVTIGHTSRVIVRDPSGILIELVELHN